MELRYRITMIIGWSCIMCSAINAVPPQDSLAWYMQIYEVLQKDIDQYNIRMDNIRTDEYTCKAEIALNSPLDTASVRALCEEMQLQIDSFIINPENKIKLDKAIKNLEVYPLEWQKMLSAYKITDDNLLEEKNRLSEFSVGIQIVVFLEDGLAPYLTEKTMWHSFAHSSIPYLRTLYIKKEKQMKYLVENPKTTTYDDLVKLLDLNQ